MSEEFAKDVIEGIWDSWYGELRGNANVDQMGDILEIAKQKIITKTRTTDTELTRLKRQVEVLREAVKVAASALEQCRWAFETYPSSPNYLELKGGAHLAVLDAQYNIAAADRIAKGEV